VGKALKYTPTFCSVEDAGEKGTFD